MSKDYFLLILGDAPAIIINNYTLKHITAKRMHSS